MNSQQKPRQTGRQPDIWIAIARRLLAATRPSTTLVKVVMVLYPCLLAHSVHAFGVLAPTCFSTVEDDRRQERRRGDWSSALHGIV